MIIGQGVSKTVADQLVGDDETVVSSVLKLAHVQHQAIALQTGFIQSIDSFKLGTIVQRLGIRIRFSFQKVIHKEFVFDFRRWSIEING